MTTEVRPNGGGPYPGTGALYSVQPVPFHHRCAGSPCGSGYQPGGMASGTGAGMTAGDATGYTAVPNGSGGSVASGDSSADQAMGGSPASAARSDTAPSALVCDVHCEPFHQRSPAASGSEYQPALRCGSSIVIAGLR